MTIRDTHYKDKMISRVLTLLIVGQVTCLVPPKVNNSRGHSRTVYGVPRVPDITEDRIADKRDYYDDVNYSDRDNRPYDQDRDNRPYDRDRPSYDRDRPSYDYRDRPYDNDDLGGPCESLLERLKDELSRDQSTLTVYSRGSNQAGSSAKVRQHFFDYCHM